MEDQVSLQNTTAPDETSTNDPRFAWDVSILTLPSDILKRVTRDRKYAIESIQNSVQALESTTDCTADGVKSAIERIMAKLQEQRTRLAEIGVEEKRHLDQCKARVQYLLRIKQPQNIKNMTYVEWNAEERFQLLLNEYIARHGYSKSLRYMLQQEADTRLIDVDVFEELQQLVVSLERHHSCRPALTWCKSHQAKLRKLKSSLPFHLHVQEFIQILSDDSRDASHKQKQRNAIAYARKNLTPYASIYPSEFQQAAGALVLRKPPCAFENSLFSTDRWRGLVDQLRHDFFRIHGLPLVSPLEIHVQAGIAALKTPQGMQGKGGEHNPLRHPSLRLLAEELPCSKRTVSKLVCPITGKIMEGSNAPLVLPNGYVYGEAAIRGGFLSLDTDLSDDQHIQCPITKDVFSVKDARRAYIV